jgi:hypothetical protein
MTTNILKCNHCKGTFIGEEFEGHECQRLKTIFFDTKGNIAGSYDGINFFPLASPTESQQRNKTTGESTEPIFLKITVVNL